MSVIETEHLHLRPFTPADAEAYYAAILADARVMEFLPGGKPTPPQRAAAIVRGMIEHWDDHGYGLWALIDQASGELIGHCGLQQLDNKADIELAYALARGFWRRGLATEAAQATVRYGFETLNLPKIVAVVVPENKAAQAVLRKIGLKFERRARVYQDILPLYSIEQGTYQPDAAFQYQVSD